MDFDEIMQALKALMSRLGLRKERREERQTNTKLDAELPPFKGWQAPFSGELKSSGGFDPTGKGNVGRPHQGVDLRNPGGTPILPLAPGKVTQVYNDVKGGRAVVIQHANGYTSYYAHMGTISVHPNEILDYSSVIGTCGASGNAKEFPHLHLQVWHNGTLIDPATILNIPPYKPYDAKKEGPLWIPGAKEFANNWNLQDHLNNGKKRT